MSEHPLRRRLLAAAAATLTAVTGLVAVAEPASAWVPKTPRLSTPWSGQVPVANPLPEYPRPQLVRSEWQNLNGIWQFGSAPNLNNPPLTTTPAEEIRVPYPIESALSGIERHHQYAWYKRTFTVPTAWTGRRVQLNFGAVMWESRVWVNGTQVGTHTGGYDPFSFDITAALRSGQNTIVVGVNNPVDSQDIPIGKQRLNPNGIWYTPYTGIWQTVWLEPTQAARITRLDTTPNLAAGALDLTVQGTAGQQVTAQVLTGGQVVATGTGTTGANIRIPIPNARLWSPDDPFLYDLRVTLNGGDTATGYFGMRSVGKAMLGGVLRPTINGKFVYQLGTLDQGYWPDGISTAPTDEALRFDLEQQKALGFNMVRKHIKVEPARWFYHADRLGLLVWQDMPSLPNGRDANASGRAIFESELRRMIAHLKGITSVVHWVPFNEGWGEYDAGRIADLVKSLDPTRLVNHNSGSNCCESDPDPGNGDVIDDHHYVGPAMTRLPSDTRIAVLGEYGGLGMRAPGHEWNPAGPHYSPEWLPDFNALTGRYVQTAAQLIDLITTRGMSASVYTEPTDVENELNGFFTYDRQVRKMDFARVREVNLRVLGAARGTTLPVGQLASLRVTNAGLTGRYLRHRDGAARTDVITTAGSTTDRQDATFHVRPGLSNAACYSFESRNFPGRYLRHRGYRVYNEVPDIPADATFCAREGLSGGGTSLESANLPGHFLRHRNDEVWVEAGSGAGFAADATWNVTAPLWRSGADLPVGQARSFRVVTPGFDNRWLRHRDGAARTDVITAASPALDREDATFVVRTGLGDNSCYSFESRNFPGRFLRHRGHRVYNDQNDATPLFAQDATFCAQPGRLGGAGNVSLAAVNVAGGFIRHYNEEVWVATQGAGHAWDNPSSFDADATWNNAAPWS
ncbi:AbfB domain-containing protein [Spirilliplanes yamanashiensis]|uniref:Beta-galactosidase n=1 Tax=Spirilliplanes yamanashiensis TaxID=42233 RepID=A0A8J3Y5W7_9ACTN|nr:AbfB domain-containing protein [Spirilliplanes yamanashiensis]MDP9819234.1 hypothetical protein [Spirilliplanes yamanashiensis]GIJ01943.1 hypothetical protein Sya03_12950 [Spirilliplanes yamanashiensis]